MVAQVRRPAQPARRERHPRLAQQRRPARLLPSRTFPSRPTPTTCWPCSRRANRASATPFSAPWRGRCTTTGSGPWTRKPASSAGRSAAGSGPSPRRRPSWPTSSSSARRCRSAGACSRWWSRPTQDQRPAQNKDVILLCLDPDTGRLLWSQDVASAADPLGLDAARRMQPVHLAYGDGVLVIPTNTGSVVALDPLTHDLLWAHVYREPTPNPNGFPGFDPNLFEAAWKGRAHPLRRPRRADRAGRDRRSCASTCATAPSSGRPSAHRRRPVRRAASSPTPIPTLPPPQKRAATRCWSSAGPQCRTLSLARGEEIGGAWRRERRPDWGRHAASQYLLPLRTGNVFVIDVANPNASTVLEGRPDDTPPGNLIFHGGDLWSQSVPAVTAYARSARVWTA